MDRGPRQATVYGVAKSWTRRAHKSLNHAKLFVTPWTIQPMEFSRPEYWSGLPFPAPGALPDPGIEALSPALAGGFFTAESPGKPDVN